VLLLFIGARARTLMDRLCPFHATTAGAHDRKAALADAGLHLGCTPIRSPSCAVDHVERSVAESRHLATNLAWRQFGARFLRAAFGLGRNDKERPRVIPNRYPTGGVLGLLPILSCTRPLAAVTGEIVLDTHHRNGIVRIVGSCGPDFRDLGEPAVATGRRVVRRASVGCPQKCTPQAPA